MSKHENIAWIKKTFFKVQIYAPCWTTSANKLQKLFLHSGKQTFCE